MQGSTSPAVRVVVEANATERESPAALPGLRRDLAAGALPPCPPRPGPPGRGLGGPHQSTHAVITALSSGLTARSLLCVHYLDGYLQISGKPRPAAGASAPGLLPDPLTVWHQRAKDPSAHDGGLVLVPTPLPAPGLEFQTTSRAVGGRDTASLCPH